MAGGTIRSVRFRLIASKFTIFARQILFTLISLQQEGIRPCAGRVQFFVAQIVPKDFFSSFRPFES
jgi:hypothetical protein